MGNTNALPLTAEERARLMWRAGFDTMDIARRLQITEATVYRWLVRWGTK